MQMPDLNVYPIKSEIRFQEKGLNRYRNLADNKVIKTYEFIWI